MFIKYHTNSNDLKMMIACKFALSFVFSLFLKQCQTINEKIFSNFLRDLNDLNKTKIIQNQKRRSN